MYVADISDLGGRAMEDLSSRTRTETNNTGASLSIGQKPYESILRDQVTLYVPRRW